MKPEIVEIQSWRYKTIVVIKRQQQTTISKKQPNRYDGISSATHFRSRGTHWYVVCTW